MFGYTMSLRIEQCITVSSYAVGRQLRQSSPFQRNHRRLWSRPLGLRA